MKNIKISYPKKVDLLKLRKKSYKRFKILELEKKLAKAGFKGFY